MPKEEEIARRYYSFIRSFKRPSVQMLATLTSPIKVELLIKNASFGDQVSIDLQGTVRYRVRGIPGVNMILTVNEGVIFEDRTGRDGSIATSSALSRPGDYYLRAYVGAVIEQNPAYDSKKLSVLEVSVESPISVLFEVNGTSFEAPRTLLFPQYAGGPVYSLKFPAIVDLGTNNGWLLLSPTTKTVSKSERVTLDYVKPVIGLSAPTAYFTPEKPEPITLTGVITTEEFKAIPGQPITFAYLNPDDSEVEIATVFSDSFGAAKTTITLPPGEFTYRIRANWRGMNYSGVLTLSPTPKEKPPEPPPEEPFVAGDVIMNVIVTDKGTGSYIQGAQVDALGNKGATNEQGRFTTTLRAGTWGNLRVSYPSPNTTYEDYVEQMTVPSAAVAVFDKNISLIPTAIPVQIWVTDARTGQPIEGATVTLGPNTIVITFSGKTGASGSYGWVKVPRGTWIVTLSHPNYPTISFNAVVDPLAEPTGMTTIISVMGG